MLTFFPLYFILYGPIRLDAPWSENFVFCNRIRVPTIVSQPYNGYREWREAWKMWQLNDVVLIGAVWLADTEKLARSLRGSGAANFQQNCLNLAFFFPLFHLAYVLSCCLRIRVVKGSHFYPCRNLNQYFENFVTLVKALLNETDIK